MAELIPLNEESLPPPFGFHNIGFTCYFNSVLQALISCTSFTEDLMKNRKEYEKHPVAGIFCLMINLYQELMQDKADQATITQKMHKYAPAMWKNMMVYASKKYKGFQPGQQCASEGYNILLDTMDEFTELNDYFIHRYKTSIYCHDCQDWVTSKNDTFNMFEVQADLRTEQIEKFAAIDEDYNIARDMNSFLAKQNGYADKDFKCPKCNKKGEKFLSNKLVMVPEVLVVLAKKYDKKKKLNVVTPFPEILSFNKLAPSPYVDSVDMGVDDADGERKDDSEDDGQENKKLYFRAVAQVEHAGGRNGGHYWAICRRNDGWYRLDDMSVSKAEFGATANTYMVFYHFVS